LCKFGPSTAVKLKVCPHFSVFLLQILGKAWRHRSVQTRCVVVGPGPKVLIEIESMSWARPTLLDAIAAHRTAHFECLVKTKALVLSVREHARQGLDKLIDSGHHVHFFSLVAQHEISVALFAHPGLMQGVVFGHRVCPVLALFDGIGHVLVV